MSKKATSVLVISVIGICAVGFVAWLIRSGASDQSKKEEVKVVSHEEEHEETPNVPAGAPKPAKHGPYPKVVVDKTIYRFGVMEYGQEGSHRFVVRNEGEAPLELFADPNETTCQCTVGKLKKTRLMPGESTEIELKWHIKTEPSVFSHSALVRTNDPKKTQFRLRIIGWVGEAIGIFPSDTWNFGTIGDETVQTCSGIVYSDLIDNFKVVKVETTNPLLSAKWEKLEPAELAKILGRDKSQPEALLETIDPDEIAELNKEEKFDLANVKPPPPKSGYRVTLTLRPGSPIGQFREEVKIVTDARDGITKSVYLEGFRPGPIQLIASEGLHWLADRMTIAMGRFRASEGKVGKFSLFVDDVPGGLKLEVVEKTPAIVKVELKRDERFHARKRVRYIGRIEVPPGAEPMALTSQQPGKIVLKTNHPDAETIPIKLVLVSY
ncbi:MAG: DUF1573 domain-containing protein [Planctomycetes bacterium]|nr:DUF1573 domain-containing protein [Planctomycetota bacterium]